MKNETAQQTPTYQQFMSRFSFSAGPSDLVGIEDERVLEDRDGKVSVGAHRIIAILLESCGQYSYELTDSQVEHNGKPCSSMKELIADLQAIRARASMVAQEFGLWLVSMPVAPADMPLDICPAKERYARMAAALRARGVLLQALQVSSLQINISRPDWPKLLDCYNRLVEALPQIMRLGDRTGGKRMQLYGEVVDGFGFDPQPRIFESPEHMYGLACEMGWVWDPNSHHPHIRIKPSPADAPPLIEIRPPDAIGPIEEVEQVVAEILNLAGIRAF